jgi:hypothetical protein
MVAMKPPIPKEQGLLSMIPLAARPSMVDTGVVRGSERARPETKDGQNKCATKKS